MQEVLIKKLHDYLKLNNADVLLALEEKNGVTPFLSDKVASINYLVEQLKKEEKPPYIIEELCMDELTKEFRPSKYNYVNNILDEDFEFAYLQFKRSGTLLFEVINIIKECEPAFEALGFTEENESSRDLKYAVTGIIDKYLSK